MRRFVYASGGSHKFWSIGRDGTTVTVHFGRVGTDGQTQVKELGSDAEADAHMARLVTQKTKKGYTEDQPATVEATQETPATAEAAPKTPAPAEPAPEPAAPAEPAPTSQPVRELPDEDALVLPPESWHLVNPRRGGRFAPPLDADPARAWQLVDEFRDEIVTMVRNQGGNADPGKALAYLEDRSGGPYDAAVVGTIVDWALTENDDTRAYEAETFVDAWVAEHGLDFATRAVMARDSLLVYKKALNRRKANMRYSSLPRGLNGVTLGRLRAHLAAAGDDEHAAAVAALEEYRGDDHQLVVTAFLVPERTDWVRAAVATQDMTSWLLLEAISGLDQLGGLEVSPYDLIHGDTVAFTMLDGIGPAIAPFFATLYDKHAGAFGDACRSILATLAIIPTDEAFDLLLRRATKRWVRPYLQEAMDRFPVRAARKLATAANPTARELLRTHASRHRDLLAKADLPDAVRATLAGLPEPVPEATTLPPPLAEPPWSRTRVAAKTVVLTGLTSDRPSSGCAGNGTSGRDRVAGARRKCGSRAARTRRKS